MFLNLFFVMVLNTNRINFFNIEYLMKLVHLFGFKKNIG